MADDERQRLGLLKVNLQRRALVCESIRTFFNRRGYFEVETPVRVPVVAPEPQIVPFASEGWFLSTSPELHMKRLLAAGYDRIFQISRCFRRGERGRWHNPEFTMLEWYRAGADYRQIVDEIEQLVVTVAGRFRTGRRVTYQGREIDLRQPWPRITVREAFLRDAGWDPVIQNDEVRFDTDLVTRVVPAFPADRPTVLTDYPAAMASLARLKPDASGVAERAEVFIAGLELANVYTELTDRVEQERRFREAVEQINRERGQTAAMPQKFIDALPDMPACGGVALGVDRLVMLVCDAASVDEVMPFTSDTV
jgi:elongation factor P--(R)-beta-lysine ligase